MHALLSERINLAFLGRSWRTDLDAAPHDEALYLQTSRELSPFNKKPSSLVGIRKADGWHAVARAGQVYPLDDVTSWAPLLPSYAIAPRRGNTPNLFVLGAGKSGTTTLHAILRQHPDVHATKVKEPTFFCSQFQDVSDPAAYFQLFDSTARYRVESSHAYLTNPETAPILKTLFPAAKFILTLRDPKNRAYSLYRHMRRLKHPLDREPYEPIADFASAIRAEDERAMSKEFLETCRQYYWNYLYCRSSLYDGQLQRYLSLFDRSQFHVVSLAELSRDPVGATEGIARFLDIDPSPAKHFEYNVKNRDRTQYLPYCSQSAKVMDAAFDGLTARTDAIVGRALDWSM